MTVRADVPALGASVRSRPIADPVAVDVRAAAGVALGSSPAVRGQVGATVGAGSGFMGGISGSGTSPGRVDGAEVRLARADVLADLGWAFDSGWRVNGGAGLGWYLATDAEGGPQRGASPVLDAGLGLRLGEGQVGPELTVGTSVWTRPVVLDDGRGPRRLSPLTGWVALGCVVGAHAP
jgi:hypothetical protein